MSGHIHRLLSERRRSARTCTRRNQNMKSILPCGCDAEPLKGVVRLKPSQRRVPCQSGFIRYSNAKIFFQSFFMLMIIQPSFFASS
jgi:hypothetical protein